MVLYAGLAFGAELVGSLAWLVFLSDTIMVTSPAFTDGPKALNKQLCMWPLTRANGLG